MVASMLTLAAPVRAQESEADGDAAEGDAVRPENQQAVQEAQERFAAGLSAFDARDFDTAIEQFTLAARLIPSADLWFNIARAHEEANEYGPAIEYYQRYLRDRPEPPDQAIVEQRIEVLGQLQRAREERESAAPTEGTLRFSSPVENVRVRVDEEDVGVTPIVAPFVLETGTHRVAATAPGFIAFEAEVDVAAGVLPTTAHLSLQQETQYRAERGDPIWAWIVGGLGVAAIVSGLVYGTVATERDDPRVDQRRVHGLSDALLGTGVVLAAGGIVLYFLEGRSVSTQQVATGGGDGTAPGASGGSSGGT